MLHVVEIERNNKLESDFLIEYQSSCYPSLFQQVSCSYMPWLRRPSSISVATTVEMAGFLGSGPLTQISAKSIEY